MPTSGRGPAPQHSGARPSRRRRRAAAALVAAAALTSGCAGEDAPNNPPGTNLRVDDIAVRYAHLEDPDAPGTGYRPGDDVPLYLWLVNESGEPATLTDVSSPVASDVVLTDGQVPVELPVGELVRMGPDEAHFVLQGITARIRGAELVPVDLTFSDDTTVQIMVEAVEVGPLD